MRVEGEIRAGDAVMLTAGEYSAYRVECLIRASKDFNIEEVWKIFFGHAPLGRDQRGNWAGSREVDMSSFCLWLTTNGYAVEEPLVEFHIDSPEYPHDKPWTRQAGEGL